MWVACGNPPTFAKAGSMGIGAIAFNFEPIHNLKGRVDAYKEAIQSPTDQVGQFKNDNVMMTNAVVCLKDRDRAREIAMSAGRGYLVTMVNLYHDTMPKSPDAITWPNAPIQVPWTDELLDQLIEGGYMLCGTPEEVCEQLVRYQAVGCDQVVFGMPGEGIEHEEILEMLELFGDVVIPEFDRDPVHSTTRYREAAQPRFPMFNHPVPDIGVELLPSTALKPLA
jgi:alkanesulfonate monooxygenase SsuD/methylene tetrahydromethanopterin reductase-like flavin-dependent oxidoreductase (luciferase family)